MYRITTYSDNGSEILNFNFSICPDILTNHGLIVLKTSKSIISLSAQSSFGVFSDSIKNILWDLDYPQVEMMGQVNEQIRAKNKIVFVSSKNGTPINIYYGKKISYKSCEIPGITILSIDGVDMILYNLSFTVLAHNSSLAI